MDHTPTLSKTFCCSSHTCCSLTLPAVTLRIIFMNKAPPGVWYAPHVLTLKSKYLNKKQDKEKLQQSLMIAADFCWWRTDDWAVEAPWATCKQILHTATGEMSESFKGFIVSKLFTGETLHIYTRNMKVGVIQGRSWTEWCSVCFSAVCSYGSMLLIKGDLDKHDLWYPC